MNTQSVMQQALGLKWMDGHTQHWKRIISFSDGRNIHFKSHWHHAGGNELIEYVIPFLGLRMAVSVDDGKLHYAAQQRRIHRVARSATINSLASSSI